MTKQEIAYAKKQLYCPEYGSYPEQLKAVTRAACIGHAGQNESLEMAGLAHKTLALLCDLHQQRWTAQYYEYTNLYEGLLLDYTRRDFGILRSYDDARAWSENHPSDKHAATTHLWYAIWVTRALRKDGREKDCTIVRYDVERTNKDDADGWALFYKTTGRGDSPIPMECFEKWFETLGIIEEAP